MVIGEGGSGGALALGVADEVWMLENSIYSVISPEGCASILWKDSTRVREASERLKLTAEDLLSLGVVERVYKENSDIYSTLKKDITETFQKNLLLESSELIDRRYKRFRKMGTVSAHK